MKHLAVILIVLLLASLACSLDFNPPPLSLTPPNVAATSTPLIIPVTLTSIPLSPTAYSTPDGSALSLAQLKNAEYKLPFYGHTVKLVDGKYEQGSGADYMFAQLLDQVAFGDLNGDGLGDAAILLAENGGGSGVFVSVIAILNQNGQPVQGPAAPVDDRPKINKIAIENGEIFLDAIIHGINEPMCCPATPSTRNYRLLENELVLARFSTKTSAGDERIISIDAPVDGDQISGAFVIKGGVTISPFENNLVYQVFLQGRKEPVAQAGFLVSADEMGGPGTFELPLDFSVAGFKGPIRVEISDLSAADGSILALNTVFVVIK
ncbi:MAG: hypothetical protein NT121_06105 [Chloroflexi bacterium]|nr:hypothetical protein [Chloroflexota bacterium]